MSKRASGQFARHALDSYETPPEAVAPLLPYLVGIERFCEPCCGDGALRNVLEQHGLVCVYAGDLANGQNALAIARYDAPVITNPPYDRPLMHALIGHWLASACEAWLLLEWDWLATKQARRFLPHISDVVIIGRVRWIAGSPSVGYDNYCWVRFAVSHWAGPRLHAGGPPDPDDLWNRGRKT